MKLIFENWRKHLNEAGPVDSRAESVLKWAEGDSGAKTKVAKPKTPEIEPDEYASPYEYEEAEDETREKYFGTGPDSIECIKDLRDPKKFINPLDFYSCMDDAGYEKIAAGSFRVAFTNPSNPDLVLKIVTPETMLENPALGGAGALKSMNMNRAEAKASYQTASDLVPKVYDSAKDYFWIMSEKVTPITTWRETQTFFPAWSGEESRWPAESSEDFNFYFHKLIAEDRDEEDLIKTLDNRIEYVKSGEELVNDPLILQIRDLLAQFDAPTWDIRPYNVGYATRDGKKQFVILDPGFELKKDAKSEFGPDTSSPEDSEAFSDLFKDKYAVTAPEKPGIGKLSENWRLFREDIEIKGPNDFLYDITTSSDRITITLLDPETKEPVESKKEDTNAYISLEKRTDVPHWEVSWSSSPQNSEKVGTIMYLMALELVEEGLSPDSYDTSPDAERVWSKFMQKNAYGVEKEKKEEFEHENDENPFFFVFFKPNTTILDQYSDKITQKEAEGEEKDVFDPEKEEKFEEYVAYGDEDFDWEELDYIEEQTEPYQRFSKSTYRIFINKLGKQGLNKYNVGGRMKKPSSNNLKSGPPGG